MSDVASWLLMLMESWAHIPEEKRLNYLGLLNIATTRLHDYPHDTFDQTVERVMLMHRAYRIASKYMTNDISYDEAKIRIEKLFEEGI